MQNFLNPPLKYSDGTIITLEGNDYGVTDVKGNETFEFKENAEGLHDEYDFHNGEKVLEYVGAASTGNLERIDLSWARAMFEPHFNNPGHAHGQITEWYYITSGEGKVLVEDREYAVSPGSLVEILPGQRHRVETENSHLTLLVKAVKAWVPEDVIPVKKVNGPWDDDEAKKILDRKPSRQVLDRVLANGVSDNIRQVIQRAQVTATVA